MEQRNNGRGIFYGVIGVATLVVAIIGATFAYFTASASNNNIITGDMATVKLSLSVTKVTNIDEKNSGMIPMSNGMVEAAAVGKTTTVDGKEVVTPCQDDNGNAVCQIYKITLTNSSTAGQFVDGYVSLKGGSGVPTDYTTTWTKYNNATEATTMRWAQVFATEKTAAVVDKDTEEIITPAVYTYSTKGTQNLSVASGNNVGVTFDETLANTTDGFNLSNIRTSSALMETVGEGDATIENPNGTTTKLALIGGSNMYDVIGTNYIRVSDHAWSTTGADETYNRDDDITSALVFNHNIAGGSAADYYIVVWLSETGTNQTAGSGGSAVPETAADFFSGNVTFISAQGSEVSATFSSYARVDRID